MTTSPAEAHWAPPQLVLASRLLDHAGHLQVTWERDDLRGGRATSARLTPSQPLPPTRGVYALVEDGAVRYVGFTEHLPIIFGPRGLGRMTAKDCQDERRAEHCRLRGLILDVAAHGRVVDVYLLTDPVAPRRRWWQRPQPAAVTVPPRDLAADAAQIDAAVRGDWQPREA